MKILDTLLIVTIAGVLPVGILVAKIRPDKQEDTLVPPKIVDSKATVQNNTVETPSTKNTFELVSLSYATQSGKLTLTGTTQTPNQALYYSIIPKPDSAPLPEFGQTRIYNESKPVTVYAAFPEVSGSFMLTFYQYIPSNTIEIRLAQGDESRTYEGKLKEGLVRRQ